MNGFLTATTALLGLTAVLPAQQGWETSSQDGFWKLALRPSLEATLWAGDEPAPALLDLPDATFLAPRLSLAVDATAGPHWYFHATGRWDRGFDAGENPDGEVRLDELLLRFRPFGDQRLNLQAGKFPTVFGAWTGGHDFFDDPFLLPPLPYAQIIGVNTRTPAATSPPALAARARGTAPALSQLEKKNWGSLLWGPVYASGAAVTGSGGPFDYAFELKNAGLSSHPDNWTPDSGSFGDPALSGRLGFRPDAAWAFGLSAGRGPWLEKEAGRLLPDGISPGDLPQSTLGLDVRWAHRDLIVSGELVAAEFETLSSGDLRSLAWFLQARWKAAPGFWLAARFGQAVFDEARGPAGTAVPWSPDIWRAEAAAGWQLSPRLLLKAGYSFTHSSGDDFAGEHLLGLGVGWRL